MEKDTGLYVPPGWLPKEWGTVSFADRVGILGNVARATTAKTTLDRILVEVKWYQNVLAQIKYLTQPKCVGEVKREREDRDAGQVGEA